jgi:succinate dehydrogenase/fumarate reductase flavoprotein subunit
MSFLKEIKEERIDTDILVIGGGLAGSFAAIKAKEAGIERVTLVSKG